MASRARLSHEPFATTRFGTTSAITLPIPNDPGLLGGTFYAQGLVSDPLANAFGVITTNAGAARIGGR